MRPMNRLGCAPEVPEMPKPYAIIRLSWRCHRTHGDRPRTLASRPKFPPLSTDRHGPSGCAVPESFRGSGTVTSTTAGS